MTSTQFPKLRKKQTLADQVAQTIKGSILAGELNAGDGLPTEPELSAQFGVSRAVVRDATRILMAQGLVDVQQGSGVYVTPARNAAFGEALLLSLQRMQATAWDVEQFERILLPEVVALAALTATDADLAALRTVLDEYLTGHVAFARTWRDVAPDQVPAAETATLAALFQRLFQTLFEITHNQILALLAEPLTRMHGMRRWEGADFSTEHIVSTEREVLSAVVNAICARDPQAARDAVANIQQLPAEAVQAMKATSIGDAIDIRID